MPRGEKFTAEQIIGELREAEGGSPQGKTFVMDRMADGRAFRIPTIVDEFIRECLEIDVGRKLASVDVLKRLSTLFVRRGMPDHIRSDKRHRVYGNAGAGVA